MTSMTGEGERIPLFPAFLEPRDNLVARLEGDVLFVDPACSATGPGRSDRRRGGLPADRGEAVAALRHMTCVRCARTISLDDPDAAAWDAVCDGTIIVCPGCLTAEELRAMDDQDYFDEILGRIDPYTPSEGSSPGSRC